MSTILEKIFKIKVKVKNRPSNMLYTKFQLISTESLSFINVGDSEL